MFPLSDPSPDRARFPLFNLVIFATCVGAFIYEVMLPEPALEALVQTFGLVPRELMSGRDAPPRLPAPLPIWATLVTSMFLHGGWLHLAGNMLYLWVFGDNIEHEAGHIWYLLLYLVCGLAAAGAQIAVAPQSSLPMIGASGAIAGVLGAYLVLFPSARVTTIVIAGWPRLVQVPAAVLIGLWALLQVYAGLGSLGVETQPAGGVAYWAHIGGFFCGLLLGVVVFLLRRWSLSRQQISPAAQVDGWAPPAARADVGRLAVAGQRQAAAATQDNLRRRVQSVARERLRPPA